jgi:hypothetical protein
VACPGKTRELLGSKKSFEHRLKCKPSLDSNLHSSSKTGGSPRQHLKDSTNCEENDQKSES